MNSHVPATLSSDNFSKIILYFKDIKTIEEFTMVNKKCSRVLMTMEKNIGLGLTDEMKCKMKTEGEVVQTRFELNFISPSINDIHLELISDELGHVRILQEFQHKITELVFKPYISLFDIHSLDNLKKLHIILNSKTNPNKFFKPKQKRIDYVRIEMINCLYSDFLNNITDYNFGKVVVDINYCNSLKQSNIQYFMEEAIKINGIFNNVTLVCDKYYNGIDKRVIVKYSKKEYNTDSFFKSSFGIVLNEQFNIKDIMLYYPFRVTLHSLHCHRNIVDLNYLPYLNYIDSTSPINYLPPPNVISVKDNKFVTQLTNISKLWLDKCGNHVILPTSVTTLTINKNTCIISNLNYIQNLHIENGTISFLPECFNITSLHLFNSIISNSLKKLTKLVDIKLIKCTIQHKIDDFYPISLESLRCSYDVLPKSLQITKLELLNPPKILNLSKYCSILQLQISTGELTRINYPTSLLFLHLNDITIKMLSLNNSGIKALTLTNCLSTIKISLPKQLNSLYISKCNYLEFTNVTKVILFELFILNSNFPIDKMDQTLLDHVFIFSKYKPWKKYYELFWKNK
ncbi:Leucine-rich repeat containing protein [Entamoeba marina]